MVHSPSPTAALGRNTGWRKARGEFVLFLDGDTVLNRSFLLSALTAIQDHPSVAAVWGHRREIACADSVYNRILDLDWMYATGFTEFCGGDVLMRRAGLIEVDGFDATLIAGEEPELCRRLRARGYRILHIDVPMTGHDLAMRHFSQYWKRALRAGHAYAQVSARFANTADPMWAREKRQNLVRGSFWISSAMTAVVCGVVLHTPVPVAVWMALLLTLATRTAWLARWKSRSALTLLLYGIHSQLQQIPILLGQLQFARDRRSGHSRKLMEYKGPGE